MGARLDPRSGDLRHLREQGLIETTRVPGYRDHAVSLTKDGRSLLESHRDPDHEHSQTFYAGLGRERKLEHDLQVYRAYEQSKDRLIDRGAHIERVVLDHELKSEYQRWLHERDKDHDDYDGASRGSMHASPESRMMAGDATPSSIGSSGVATSMRSGVCTTARGSIMSITSRCISSRRRRRGCVISSG
jgi:hypothetical protein